MAPKSKSRLGRGLNSLISLSIEEPAAVATARSEGAQDQAAGEGGGSSPSAEAPHAKLPGGLTGPILRELPPPAAADEPAGSRVVEVPLDQVVPNPHQPRRQMNEATIAELAASLKSTGLIQPIVVRKAGAGYELIAGERRWRAARLAGLATVPAILREASAAEQAQMALVENIQRENLNPIDRAAAYRTLLTQLGLTQAELAQRLGEDRSSIANHLRLLDLSEVVQAMVVDGKLSLGHAKILAGLPEREEQERLAEIVVNQSLSVRNLERQLDHSAAPEKPAHPAEADGVSAHYQELERTISRQLGMRVQLRASSQKKSGKLVLHYANLVQFEDLMGRLGVDVEPE